MPIGVPLSDKRYGIPVCINDLSTYSWAKISWTRSSSAFGMPPLVAAFHQVAIPSSAKSPNAPVEQGVLFEEDVLTD